MNKMMEKMMSGMMKPEDMPQMMDTMMEKMLGQMSADDRMAFIGAMMPKCLNMIFSELDSDAKQNLAREMITTMMSIFEGQLKSDTEAEK